ncbi:Lysosomal aspartic protease [Colletotrichum higginsianum]|uniref:Lysosomal aspartic protease n=1 Tax=Colletotrichum higginsianum TaxID=80884 RepID=A0A4T0WAA0_9PEZI|nr:Lysosomal aspartic protease [Colletotrichum higginsianum]
MPLLLLFIFSLLSAVLTVSATRIPIAQRRPSGSSPLQVAKRSLHAASKIGSCVTPGTGVVPETFDGGFWFGSFDVGLSKNLSLLIDTGSSDLAVNPDRYKGSSTSVNLQRQGTLGYGTVFENGCGVAEISYSVFNDSMSFANLSVPIQTFASVKFTPPPDNGTVTQFPRDGVAGLGSSDRSGLKATPFFHQLCDQGTVKECRFGLAFKGDGTGVQVLGEVDETLFSGSLAKATIKGEWLVGGDVRVGEQLVVKNKTMLLDSGTANVVGPIAQVAKLFETAGIQAVNLSLPGCTKVMTGHYPCDKPPAITFGLNSGSKDAFGIEAAAFKQAVNGGNNCTATITGIDNFRIWVIGQSWFRGKYIDFDVTGKTIGVAYLKDK